MDALKLYKRAERAIEVSPGLFAERKRFRAQMLAAAAEIRTETVPSDGARGVVAATVTSKGPSRR